MTLQPHPESDRLFRALQRLAHQARPWAGVIYRSSSPEYAASDDLVSGAGARRHGGRWNPPDVCAAVYGSLTPELALSEVLEHYRYYGLEPWNMGRRVICPLRAEVSALLDLTQGRVRQRLRVSLLRMRQEDWRTSVDAGKEALTQAIGRAASAARLEALLVPSKPRAGSSNLVAFPANLQPGSFLRELVPDS